MSRHAMQMAVLLVALCLLSLYSGTANSTRPENLQSAEPVRVVISREAGHAVYRIGSKALSDPLRSFEQLYQRHGDKAEILLIFDLDANIRDVYEAKVLASKAGFTRTRVFANNSASGFMSEITFGSSIRSE